MRIAVGNSRMDKKWKNKDMSWEDFKAKANCKKSNRSYWKSYAEWPD